MSEANQELNQLLRAHIDQTELHVTDQQIVQLMEFVNLIHKWNRAYNLTSVRDPKQMVIKHIMDSIIVAPHLTQQHYIDVGTGPGLPGIPLAIMHPDKSFILLDSLGKRVRFMKQVAYELKLSNIQPVQARVEDFQSQVPIDVVLSRAFASLKDMLHWCQHLVDSAGTFVALKGQLPQQEIDELPEGFKITEIVRLQIPNLTGERHLIKIVKG